MEKTKKECGENPSAESRYCNLRVSKETFSLLMNHVGASPCFPCSAKQEEKKKND